MERNYQTDNKSFVVYKEWEELLSALDNDEQAGQLFKALFAFSKRGEEAEFTGALKMAFIVMRNAIERDGEKWEETCATRSDCGKLGGRPPKAKETNAFSEKQKNQKLFEKAKEADNVYVNDNVNVNENVNVNVGPSPAQERGYGQYGNVKLTQWEYDDLCKKYSRFDIEIYINRVDKWLNDNPNVNPYPSHYKTILDWLEKDKIKNSDEGDILKNRCF